MSELKQSQNGRRGKRATINMEKAISERERERIKKNMKKKEYKKEKESIFRNPTAPIPQLVSHQIPRI